MNVIHDPICVKKIWYKFSSPIISWISLLSIVIMAGSMKLFLFFQKIHQTLGIHPPQAFQKKFLINSSNVFYLVGLAHFALGAFEFLIWEGNSLFDIGLVFYVIIISIACIVFYIIFIWQNENTLSFIKDCEKFIENSKWHIEYTIFIKSEK